MSLVLVAVVLGVPELTRAECRKHFDSVVKPMLLREVVAMRPSTKLGSWKFWEKEDRTEWQPNGLPTKKLGYSFRLWSQQGPVKVNLTGVYMEKYAKEVHVKVGFEMGGSFQGDHWRRAFVNALGLKSPFKAPYAVASPKSFPKVVDAKRTWQLWVGPLSSTLKDGKSLVEEAEFTAITVVHR